jgi:hypothetical protein
MKVLEGAPRCSHCKHLWKFHTQTRKGGPWSCSKCIMRKNLGPGFIRKGELLGPHFSHDLRPRLPWCSCFLDNHEGCYAVIWHGPGHQSHTHCQIAGPHKIHSARYGEFDQWAEWKTMKVFSGYFDEPPLRGRR